MIETGIKLNAMNLPLISTFISNSINTAIDEYGQYDRLRGMVDTEEVAECSGTEELDRGFGADAGRRRHQERCGGASFASAMRCDAHGSAMQTRKHSECS